MFADIGIRRDKLAERLREVISQPVLPTTGSTGRELHERRGRHIMRGEQPKSILEDEHVFGSEVAKFRVL